LAVSFFASDDFGRRRNANNGLRYVEKKKKRVATLQPEERERKRGMLKYLYCNRGGLSGYRKESPGEHPAWTNKERKRNVFNF
jgi:hypothetical protein